MVNPTPGRTNQPGPDDEGPGEGPEFPAGPAPRPGGGAIEVSAADLRRYSELFARTGREVAETTALIDSRLSALESRIGDDESGRTFKEQYEPGRENVIGILKFLTDFLDGVGEGLRVTADNYHRADEVANDGVHKLGRG